MPATGATTAPSLSSVFDALTDKCHTAVWRAKAGVEKKFCNHKEMLGTYKSEGYSSMTQDGNRNCMYKHAINHEVRKKGGAWRWLEIGTGAHLCLTKLVTEASPETVVCGIEVNEVAVREARAQIRSLGLIHRVRLIEGLSTDTRLLQQARKLKQEWGGYEGVVQELLGCFAGSEGAAYIMSRVNKDITNSSVLQVPTRAATFFCPVLVEFDHVAHMNLPTSAPYYVTNAFALVRRLPITRAALSSGGTGCDWLKAGLIEWLDFNKPEDLAKKQAYITIFRSTTPAQINALACWIWIETSPHGAPRRLAKTGYPWGATDAPEVANDCIALSSREDDANACASNWRNVLIAFPETLCIPANTEVRVEASSDLQSVHPIYRFVVHVGEAQRHAITITNFYPTFRM